MSDEQRPDAAAVAGSPGSLPRLDRREVLRWMALASVSVPWLQCSSLPPAPGVAPVGIGTDPDLVNPIVPWPRTLTPSQLDTTRALCDLILPADERSPAASALGVPDFVDEWISAPYERQQRDREQILAGLVWIDGQARERHGRRFHELDAAEQTALCDAIAFYPRVPPERQEAALFFLTMRQLTTGAFYTTQEGMRDLGYVGNVPLASFEGPPPALRAHLGLD